MRLNQTMERLSVDYTDQWTDIFCTLADLYGVKTDCFLKKKMFRRFVILLNGKQVATAKRVKQKLILIT